MNNFNQAFEDLILVEGGYSDDPLDAGGRTAFGISERVARLHNYQGQMCDLSLAEAKAIYRTDYWDKVKCDEICARSERMAYEVFEFGVNAGTSRAAKALQTSLNACSHDKKFTHKLKVDGKIGMKSIRRLSALCIRGYEKTLLKMINCIQGVHYMKCVEKRNSNVRFINGWFTRVEFSGGNK